MIIIKRILKPLGPSTIKTGKPRQSPLEEFLGLGSVAGDYQEELTKAATMDLALDFPEEHLQNPSFWICGDGGKTFRIGERLNDGTYLCYEKQRGAGRWKIMETSIH